MVSKEIFEKAQTIRNKRNCNMEKERLKRYAEEHGTQAPRIKSGLVLYKIQ
jgi:hypothetical protein